MIVADNFREHLVYSTSKFLKWTQSPMSKAYFSLLTFTWEFQTRKYEQACINLVWKNVAESPESKFVPDVYWYLPSHYQMYSLAQKFFVGKTPFSYFSACFWVLYAPYIFCFDFKIQDPLFLLLEEYFPPNLQCLTSRWLKKNGQPMQ